MIPRHHQGQPQHTQAADKEHRDQRRHPHIAAAAQRTGKHLDADIGNVDRRQHMHHTHAHRNDRIVLTEQPEQRLGRVVEYHADDQRDARRHRHTDPHAVAHAVVLPRTEVLPRKGRDRNAQRVDRHPEHKVDLAVDAPRRDGAGAEAVHAALDENVADVVHGALGCSGHADGADGREHIAVQPQFFGPDVPGHSLGADDAPQRQRRAGYLAEYRGPRRARNAPAEHRDKHNVQRDIDERRRNQKVQRPLGIADGTQNICAHVVEHLGDHTQKVDAQIQRCIVQYFRRRTHQAHHRLSGQQAQHRQQRTQPHAEHQRRVYLAVNGVGIVGAPALGNDNARAAAQADEQAHQQIDKRAGCAHRCQRVGAHKVADDQSIRRVVQLLEQRTEPDGQKEQQQLFGDAAGQNIRLLDTSHRFLSLFCFSRPYFML